MSENLAGRIFADFADFTDRHPTRENKLLRNLQLFEVSSIRENFFLRKLLTLNHKFISSENYKLMFITSFSFPTVFII